MTGMAKDTKTVLDRVLTWPAERQEDAVRVLTEMEEQDKSTLQLSDEQVAEVKRRLAEKNPKTHTLSEFNEHLGRRWGVWGGSFASRHKTIWIVLPGGLPKPTGLPQSAWCRASATKLTFSRRTSLPIWVAPGLSKAHGN